jgi:hypothetical protein
MAKLLGTAPNQVPTNADLGDLAYQDAATVPSITVGSLFVATKTPASASDTGTTGQIAWDADYIYVCTATDTWKRVAIATW